MTIAMFTDLITAANVTALLSNIAIVFGGIIAVMLVLAPIFLAKSGFRFVLAKVASLFGK